MLPLRLTVGALLLALLASPPGSAREVVPFATGNQNPLVLIHGLPRAVLPTALTPGATSVAVTFDVSNTYISEKRDDEQLLIDGETYNLDLQFAWVASPRLRLVFNLPLIFHEPGQLDATIDSLHDALDLPDSQRDKAPSNRLQYTYQHDGVTVMDVGSSRGGLGDLAVSTGYSVDADRTWTGWATLKLPTGQADELTGSGAADLALWLETQRELGKRWAWHARGGGLFMGEGDVLGDIQRDANWFGRGGLQWSFSDTLHLQVDLDAHGALYDSDIHFLGDTLQIVIGGWWRVLPDSRLELALREDLATGTGPDFTLHVGWRSDFVR